MLNRKLVLLVVLPALGLVVPSVSPGIEPAKPNAPLDFPMREMVAMTPVAKLPPGPVKENSGIVKSRTRDDLFWMHNDSGDEPRVYPIRRNGTAFRSEREAETPGVLIGGAINIDWEDITVDSEGTLIVADVGNNGNDRRDLTLYFIPEPSPTASRAAYLKKVMVRYPEQKSWPAGKEDFNYDCEGIFTVGTIVHFVTKHRSDSRTRLYRLDNPQADRINDLTLLEEFDVGGKAVGADASADGKRLVVITYNSIFLFERDSMDAPFFGGKVLYGPYKADQVEAVCFADDNTLLMADEVDGMLYEVSLSSLTRLR